MFCYDVNYLKIKVVNDVVKEGEFCCICFCNLKEGSVVFDD